MMGFGYAGMAMMWPWMIVWTLVGIAAIVALTLVIIRLERGSAPQASWPDNGTDSARRILDERYARGEIDHDEYRKRRDTLQ
jgi:putative membrane protein